MQIAPHRQDGVSSIVTVSALNDDSGTEAHPAARGISPRPETDGLYTAMLHLDLEDHGISMFHACRAVSRMQVMERVGVRVPSHLLAHVEIREGIDLDHPVVVRLVPREISRRLADYGDCNAAMVHSGWAATSISSNGLADEPQARTPSIALSIVAAASRATAGVTR